MRDVYTHARNIFIITRTLEQRMAFIKNAAAAPVAAPACCRARAKAVAEPVDGFKFINGEIHAT